jgi:hypothetical protein
VISTVRRRLLGVGLVRDESRDDRLTAAARGVLCVGVSRRIICGWIGVTFLCAGVLGFGSSAYAVRAASPVLDRTFGCIPLALNGTLRATDVNAAPRGGLDDSLRTGISPGFIGAASGGRGPGSELVSVSARGWHRFLSTYSAAGAYANVERCARSRTRVPLSARGLPAVPIRWSKQVTCLGRGRILVRVRATLQSPAPWVEQRDGFVGVRSRIVEASIAVRSEQTGKPLAYLELDRDGKTKLWYASSCD